MGPSHPHPFRRGTGSRAQRQRRERARLGARAEGRLPPPARRQRDDHDAVPRFRGDLHGALPQHGARGQLDAAALGYQPGRPDGAHAAPDADSDRPGRHLPRSGRRAAGWGEPMTLSRTGTSVRSNIVWGGCLLIVSLTLCSQLIRAASAQSGHAPPHAPRFPDLEVTTQNGERVRFYDLIKGKTVAIELIYTSCQFACPLETARLAQVQALLGDRVGKDIFFYSISIDPAHDTPDVLKAFAEKYHARPGWTFLTGKSEDIELLSRKLGLYSAPDPENKDGHVPALLIGNEATGQWIRGSALDNPKMTATMITNWVAGYPAAAPAKSYAEAKPVPKRGRGEYLFAAKCATCHVSGQRERIAPDLTHVVHTRDRDWLAKYIAAPDEMLQAGDPIAKALFEQYKRMPMPNLGLSEQQVSDVIAYLSR